MVVRSRLFSLSPSLIFFLTGPHTRWFDSTGWELVNEFQSSHCILAGQPGEPPLLTVYNIGVIAMPTLVKAAQVARARGQDWNKVECIPADIDLPDKYMFRSIFVCPV